MNKVQANQIINLLKSSKAKKAPRKARKPKKASLRQQCCLSDCAIKYLRCREDPFNSGPVCAPVEFSVPSQKESYHLRGTVTVSSVTGVAALTFCPMAMVCGGTNSGTSTPFPVITTTVASTLSATPSYADIAVGNAVGYNSDTYLSEGEFTAGHISVRLVASGLRIRNVTPYMYRGGSAVLVEDPGKQPLFNQSFQSLYQIDQSLQCDIDGKWNTVVYHPSDEDDLDYQTRQWNNVNSVDFASTGNKLWRPFIGFVASSPLTALQTYEFEAISHFEIIGRHSAGLTPSPADPAGVGIIDSLTSTIKAHVPTIGDRSKWIDKLLTLASNPKVIQGISGAGMYLYNQATRPAPLQRPRIDIEMID